MDETSLTDERLCWLAVRDQVERRSRGSLRTLFARMFRYTLPTTTDFNQSGGRAAIAKQLGDYAFAVDDLAHELSAEERQVLRLTRQVPAWFLPRVEERVRAMRKAR